MLLSICCICYNQVNFIEQCIESILNQKVNFQYEIIIGDDCSTDGTLEIILQYALKFKGIFKVLQGKKNIGAMENALRSLMTCSGKYVALIEGDDYWTDPYKLQKQVDFLEANQDFTICSTNAIVKDEISKTEIEWLGSNHKKVIKLRDLLRYGSGGATCTLMLRRDIIKFLPDWYINTSGGDWLLQIIAAKQGNMKYLREVTGVYRRHEGSLSCTSDILNTIKIYENFGLNTVESLKNYFDHKYDNLLNAQSAEYWQFNLMRLYLKNNEKYKARKSALFVIRNILRIQDPLKKLIIAIKIIILSF